jgi:GntR family transcriptional regulator
MVGPVPKQPMYAMIADQLRDQIAVGLLAPGDRLPSENELMRAHDVSITVARASLQLLRNEGLIDTRPGVGSTVRVRHEFIRFASGRYRRDGRAPNLLEAQLGGWEDEVTTRITPQVPANKDVAARLGIAPDDPVSQARYQWYADRELVQISTQWEPLKLTGGTPIEVPVDGTLGNPDVITRFASIGITIDRVQEMIRTRMPTPHEALVLSAPQGAPVFTITRTHLAGDQPVETADIIIRGDRAVLDNTQQVQ